MRLVHPVLRRRPERRRCALPQSLMVPSTMPDPVESTPVSIAQKRQPACVSSSLIIVTASQLHQSLCVLTIHARHNNGAAGDTPILKGIRLNVTGPLNPEKYFRCSDFRISRAQSQAEVMYADMALEYRNRVPFSRCGAGGLSAYRGSIRGHHQCRLSFGVEPRATRLRLTLQADDAHISARTCCCDRRERSSCEIRELRHPDSASARSGP